MYIIDEETVIVGQSEKLLFLNSGNICRSIPFGEYIFTKVAMQTLKQNLLWEICNTSRKTMFCSTSEYLLTLIVLCFTKSGDFFNLSKFNQFSFSLVRFMSGLYKTTILRFCLTTCVVYLYKDVVKSSRLIHHRLLKSFCFQNFNKN